MGLKFRCKRLPTPAKGPWFISRRSPRFTLSPSNGERTRAERSERDRVRGQIGYRIGPSPDHLRPSGLLVVLSPFSRGEDWKGAATC